MESVLMYVIGFTAQIFFSARTLVQWIGSEKAHKAISPTSYWVFSVLGSLLLFVYGWMRDDFSIILGQFITYYIYLWNLKQKGLWERFNTVLKVALIAVPPVMAGLLADGAAAFVEGFFRNEDVPLRLLIFGSSGQILFTFRFVYQWVYSYRAKESLLPVGFWLISLVGSSMIIIYGIIRLDPVLVLGQSFGFVAYLRNIIIIHKNRKADEKIA